jgi:hypothetical protein
MKDKKTEIIGGDKVAFSVKKLLLITYKWLQPFIVSEGVF